MESHYTPAEDVISSAGTTTGDAHYRLLEVGESGWSLIHDTLTPSSEINFAICQQFGWRGDVWDLLRSFFLYSHERVHAIHCAFTVLIHKGRGSGYLPLRLSLTESPMQQGQGMLQACC